MYYIYYHNAVSQQCVCCLGYCSYAGDEIAIITTAPTQCYFNTLHQIIKAIMFHALQVPALTRLSMPSDTDDCRLPVIGLQY